MRWFAWCLMVVSAVLIGCEKPEETIPPVTPTSGTTDSVEAGEEGHDHDEAGHHHDDEDGHEHADGHSHTEGEGHDDDHAEGEAAGPTAEGSEDDTVKPSEAPSDEDSANAASSDEVRFVANLSINVPEMMCPYACYPAVKDTLAEVPGVEGIQLAEQPEGTAEGEIKKRVVELKVKDGFDASAAIAALEKASYKSEVIN